MAWLAPMFLSALSADAFVKILFAIMLEKSVVFVSDNLPLLSSAILGMQCFLHPFQWSYVQIPILPRSLVDMVEAPMPFLVGLLRSHISEVHSLSDRVRSSVHSSYNDVERLVVNINDVKKLVTIDDRGVDLPLPQFKGLVERLVIPFSVLNSS